MVRFTSNGIVTYGAKQHANSSGHERASVFAASGMWLTLTLFMIGVSHIASPNCQVWLTIVLVIDILNNYGSNTSNPRLMLAFQMQTLEPMWSCCVSIFTSASVFTSSFTNTFTSTFTCIVSKKASVSVSKKWPCGRWHYNVRYLQETKVIFFKIPFYTHEEFSETTG